MNIQALIQYFSNIRTGEIKVKNWIPTLVFLIMLPTFFIIYFVFLGLFIAQEPITYNGTPLLPTDPTYTTTFISMLIILGVVFCIFLVGLVVSLVLKPKPWVMWTVDYDNNMICYEITRRYERLIGPDYLIILNKLNNSIYKTKSSIEAKEQLNKTLFWTILDKTDKIKIKSKPNKISLTIVDENTREKRTYSIGFAQDNIIQWYTETVSSSYAGNNNIKSMKKCHIENQNRAITLPINPLIRQTMIEMNL
ncbi:MAG: hypothetical protein CVV56_05855 [Tenericutes bacterium HGW-Tenericutes-1]|jgi:hypothetical protein|nr:MAG: hypothetical protein CVV56_05855 [Tenericutes bacterium HGW-Tenericutes-1]